MKEAVLLPSKNRFAPVLPPSGLDRGCTISAQPALPGRRNFAGGAVATYRDSSVAKIRVRLPTFIAASSPRPSARRTEAGEIPSFRATSSMEKAQGSEPSFEGLGKQSLRADGLKDCRSRSVRPVLC